jgi:tetratricopeptide (TPR) repeat protein
VATEKLDDPLGWFQIGMSFRKVAKHEEAMNAFRQAIKIKSDFAEAWYQLAMSLGDAGRREEAGIAYAQAIKLNPSLRKSGIHGHHPEGGSHGHH